MVQIGNCVNEELIDELFGSVSDFARLIEENGDEFEFGDILVKYDEDTDIHTFYTPEQAINNLRFAVSRRRKLLANKAKEN